jgi:hypothetical protein
VSILLLHASLFHHAVRVVFLEVCIFLCVQSEHIASACVSFSSCSASCHSWKCAFSLFIVLMARVIVMKVEIIVK